MQNRNFLEENINEHFCEMIGKVVIGVITTLQTFVGFIFIFAIVWEGARTLINHLYLSLSVSKLSC